MPVLLVLLVMAFVVSVALTAAMRGLADRLGILDYPDGSRHGPRKPVPQGGGMAIYVAAVATAGAALVLEVPQLLGFGMETTPLHLDQLILLWLGGSAILLLGLMDDIADLSPSVKLGVEILVAAVVFWGGLRIGAIRFPGDGITELPLWLDFGVTVLWIVGITNAFNLIDGSDGVASGAALFALLTLSVVSLVNGNATGALVVIVLLGSTLGFLVFNFPPASIFLGDSGSLFLGFVLANVGIMTTQRMPTVLAVSVPVVCFGLPILDTGLAIIRRILRQQPLFVGDRGHIHHRLRDLGHSPRGVALSLYAVCALFSLVALSLMNGLGAVTAVVLAAVGAAVIFGIQWLGFPEFRAAQAVRTRCYRSSRARSETYLQTLRIQEAVDALTGAHDGERLIAALRHVFDASEFEKVEAWLPQGLGDPLGREQGVLTGGEAVVWRWEAEAAESDPGCLWEIRLPIRGRRNVVVGRLSMWRTLDDDVVLTDLRMVALDLLPAFRDALARIADSRAEPAAKSEAPSPGREGARVAASE